MLHIPSISCHSLPVQVGDADASADKEDKATAAWGYACGCAVAWIEAVVRAADRGIDLGSCLIRPFLKCLERVADKCYRLTADMQSGSWFLVLFSHNISENIHAIFPKTFSCQSCQGHLHLADAT